MEDQDKSYQVNDKRRINADGTINEDSAQAEEPANEQQSQAAGEEAPQMPDFDVYTLLGLMIGSLTEKAWEYMGVRLAPGAKEIKKDIEQAKLAVDTVTFLVDKLNPHMSEEERKAVKVMVSELQINFVKHSS